MTMLYTSMNHQLVMKRLIALYFIPFFFLKKKQMFLFVIQFLFIICAMGF